MIYLPFAVFTYVFPVSTADCAMFLVVSTVLDTVSKIRQIICEIHSSDMKRATDYQRKHDREDSHSNRFLVPLQGGLFGRQ